MSETIQSGPPPTKEESIRNAIVGQVVALLDSHYPEIVKSAEETFRNVEGQGEIEAKVSFGVTFYPAKRAPKVFVKIAYSTRYAVETEIEIDEDQAKLPFEDLRRGGMSVEIQAGGNVVKLPAIK